MRRHTAALCLFSFFLAAPAFAEPPVVKPGDSLQTLLDGYQGKRVTVRLQGGEELTGKVRVVTKELLQLDELSGREFFDGVIDLSKVSALIVRAKE